MCLSTALTPFAFWPQIKKALQQCANQLSKKLAKRQLAKARKARKKALARYIPDVARAVYAVLSKARPSRRSAGTGYVA